MEVYTTRDFRKSSLTIVGFFESLRENETKVSNSLVQYQLFKFQKIEDDCLLYQYGHWQSLKVLY